MTNPSQVSGVLNSLFVVGVGTSAGGIEALKAFLRPLDPQNSFAYIIAQHQPAEYPSLLPRILKAETTLPVVTAAAGQRIESGKIFVAPPDAVVSIDGDVIDLETSSKGPASSIDRLFASIGRRFGSHGIGVVLSGTGKDGAQGVRDLKAAGGLCLAQDRKTARYPAMADAAIDSGCVDLVLPPERMDEAIRRHAESLRTAPGKPEQPAIDPEITSHSSQSVIIALNADSKIEHYNEPANQLFALKGKQGVSLGRVFSKIGDAPIARRVRRVIQTGKPSTKLTQSGDKRFEIRITARLGEANEILGAEITVDELAKVPTSARPDGLDRSQAVALENMSNAVFVCDRSESIQWVNRAFSTLSGYESHEALGRDPAFLYSGQHDEQFWPQVWDTILQGATWRGEVINQSKSGRLFTVQLCVTPVFDDSGEISSFVAIHEDISARKDFDWQMLHLAQRDALTGLYNRMVFHERVAEAAGLADTINQPAAVLTIDIDRFQDVNDSAGHAAGDELLIAVSRRLEQSTGSHWVVARLGGDEFAILLHGNRERVGLMVQQIINAFQAPFPVAGHDLICTVSIGAALYPGSDLVSADLLRGADLAMQRAKQTRGNSFEFYDKSLADYARDRVEMARALAASCRNGDLSLVYQPQFDLATGRVEGAEALLRWNSESWKDVPIPKLIQIAEDNGFIHEIGKWVIEESCRAAARLLASGAPPIPISINLSPLQLAREELAELIIQKLRECGVPPSMMRVEITESALLQHSGAVPGVMDALHAAGISLVLDDFGTGYSSLSYLRQYPVSSVKIDLSFVQGIRRSAQDEAIVGGIISLAHALGMRVVGEGVESDEQVRFLASHGCDAAQGFYLGTPVSIEALTANAARAAANF